MRAAELNKIVPSESEQVCAFQNLLLYSNTNNESYYDVDFDNLRIAHKRNIVLEVNTYYPYGMLNTSLSWHLTNNQFKYQSKEYLNTLNYNVLDFGARMYDPAIARFTTPDPIMQFNNGYFAMGGNPVSMIDPSGMKATTGHYDDVQEHGLSETPERGGGGSPVTMDGIPMYGSSSMIEHLVGSLIQAGGELSTSNVALTFYQTTFDGKIVGTFVNRDNAVKVLGDLTYQYKKRQSNEDLNNDLGRIRNLILEEVTNQYSEEPSPGWESRFSLPDKANIMAATQKQLDAQGDAGIELEDFMFNLGVGGAFETLGKINDVYGVAYSATEAFVGSTIILTNKLSKASNLMKGVKILKKVPAIGPLGIASDFFDAGLDAYNGDIAKSALKFGLIALKNGIRFSSPVGFAIITAIDLSVSAYDIYKDVKND